MEDSTLDVRQGVSQLAEAVACLADIVEMSVDVMTADKVVRSAVYGSG